MTETFQILIADDHPLVRGALKQALSAELDNVTVFEAGSCKKPLIRLKHAMAKSTLFCLICTCPA